MTPASRAVPVDYGSAWLGLANQLVKVNYPLVLAISSLMAVLAFLGNVHWFGVIGGALISSLGTFLAPGLLIIISDFMKLEKSEFMKLLIGIQDRDLFSRLLPLVGFNFIYNLLQGLIPMGNGFVSFLLAVIAFPLTCFSVPLITFHKMRFLETISVSVDAVIKNIVPLILLFLLMALISVGLMLLLFLPFIFFGLPLFAMLPYPVYASIFLGLDIRSLTESLKAKLGSTIG